MVVQSPILVEPIPGYKLLERIGTGGFGEVWKCEAPGGLFKAIKIVRGSMESVDGREIHAQQELKSLNRVKTVRHPYILSLERFDIIDGQLVIVMELADRSLWDRFKECRAQGLPGIPRDELLEYMAETAEALDLMKDQFQLQHLDIKPQNIFLVYNHVKVADFGLVKDLVEMKANISSGVTPVYAAPETFDGVVSSYCDQYSLAIVYQELLTGQRPFGGATIRQLLMQHLKEAPDLSALPPDDRDAIARALAKIPEDRFPSCSAMVQALRVAPATEGANSVVAHGLSRAETPPNHGLPLIGGARPERETPPARERSASPNHRLSSSASVMPFDSRTAHPTNQECTRSRLPDLADPTVTHARRPPRAEVSGDGVLFPAMVIGLGHAGLQVLQQLRKSLHEHWGSVDLKHIRLLHIDTDPQAARDATQGEPDAALSPNEVIVARLNRPAHYLKPARGRPNPEAWLSHQMICRLPKELGSTEGQRAFGRLALIDNFGPISMRLKNDLDTCTNSAVLAVSKQQTHQGMRTNRPRVYIVANLAGGTGSGMFIDMAYIMRHILRKTGWMNPDVVGLFLTPAATPRVTDDQAAANVYAALTELHHFSSSDTTFTGHYDDSEWPVNDAAPPFNRCQLLPLPTSRGSAVRQVMAQAGDFLCRDLTSPLGRIADEYRASTADPDAGGLALHTIGLNWIAWPRGALLKKVGQRLCSNLAQTWIAKGQPGLREAIQGWVKEQWDRHGLSAESMATYMQNASQRVLGGALEAAFAPMFGADSGPTGSRLEVNDVIRVLDQVHQVIGRPEGDRSPAPLMKVLDEAAAALYKSSERTLAQMAACLIDQPSYHIAGAEAAIKCVNQMVRHAIEQQQALGRNVLHQATEDYKRIQALLFDLQTSSSSSGRKGRSTTELVELLRSYPLRRVQVLVLQRVLTVYQQLIDCSAAHLQEIDYCRSRLAEVVKLLAEPPVAARPLMEAGTGQYLLPDGCKALSEAVQQVYQGITPAQVLELDQQIQDAIRKRFKSLINVCMGKTEDSLKDLAVLLQEQAETFVKTPLRGSDVVQSFLNQRPNDQRVINDIAGICREAVPDFGNCCKPTGQEVCFVATPPGSTGEGFRQLAQQALPRVEIKPIASKDEIVFVREILNLPIADLPQFGPEAYEAYERVTNIENGTPHNRTDIFEWKPLPSTGSRDDIHWVID